MNRFQLAVQTPLHSMPNLQAFLQGSKGSRGAHAVPTLMVKRDDLTPFGGGKYRKVFVLVEDAVQRGATVLLTEGSIESRHARTTAILARQRNIPCVLVLSGETDPDSHEPTLLEQSEGARILLAASANQREELMAREAQALEAQGERPLVIPFSGSTALTALAYAQAFFEIKKQTEAAGHSLDAVFFSSATGGIHAGLELGKGQLRTSRTRLIGVTPGLPTSDIKAHTMEFAAAAAKLLGAELTLLPDDICVLDQYVGDGYLQPTPESRAAIALAAELEGLALDPTYTAKTFAALIDQVRRGRFREDETVVFLHTSG